MNYKLIGLLSLAVLFFSHCKKDKDYDAIDRQLILDYLAENNLTAEEHESGLFYIHTTEGTGGHPTANSTITIRYKGYLLDGTVFDQTGDNQSVTFALPNLIEGWQIGIPLMKRGGTSKLLIPSNLGYGARETGNIPAHSVLIFDITLLDF